MGRSKRYIFSFFELASSACIIWFINGTKWEILYLGSSSNVEKSENIFSNPKLKSVPRSRRSLIFLFLHKSVRTIDLWHTGLRLGFTYPVRWPWVLFAPSILKKKSKVILLEKVLRPWWSYLVSMLSVHPVVLFVTPVS